MFSKWLHGICYCLLVVVTATVASGQGLSVNSIPNQGLVQPLNPTSSGAAGAMSAACPPGQALTHITSTDYTCLPFEGGGSSIPPGYVNQLLGYDPNGYPENQTVGGGNGNCLYTRTNLQYGSITCGNYVTFGGGTFTGTIAAPLFYLNSATAGLYSVAGSGISAGGATVRPNSVAIPANGQYLIGDAPLNFSMLAGTATDAQLASSYSGVGACQSGQFATALQRNSTPICLPPAFNSVTGTVTDAQLASAYSGVGVCPAGDVVIGLNRNSAPLCNTISGSGGAPLVNPAGGQNNYAPIDAPAFTTSIGLNSNTTSGNFLWQSPTGYVANLTTAGAASNFLGLLAGAHWAGGSNWISDSNGPMGIVMNGQIGFYGGTASTGSTWNPVMLGYFNNSGLTMGPSTSITTPSLTVAGGASITGLLTSANINNSTLIQSASMSVTGSIGIGQAAPSPGLLYGTSNTNDANAYVSLSNPNPGNSVQVGYGLQTGSGGAIYPSGMTAFGAGWNLNPTFPPNSFGISTSEPNGMIIGTNTTPNTITFDIAAQKIGTFNTSGLNLAPGMAFTQNGNNIITGNGTWTPLLIGSGPAGAAAYNTQDGYYMSYADSHGTIWITANYVVGWTGWNVAPGGIMFLCNFPTNSPNHYAMNSIGGWSGFSFPAPYTYLYLALSPSQGCANLNIGGSGASQQNLPVGWVPNEGGALQGSITYRMN